MSQGIRYLDWLENKCRQEMDRDGRMSLSTHAELVSQGFDAEAIERKYIAQQEQDNG